MDRWKGRWSSICRGRWPGRMPAMMLGDLGARVIKVESPGGRRQPCVGAAVHAGAAGNEHATYFLSCNRNKESIGST